jgi:hypothetical protein
MPPPDRYTGQKRDGRHQYRCGCHGLLSNYAFERSQDEPTFLGLAASHLTAHT